MYLTCICRFYSKYQKIKETPRLNINGGAKFDNNAQILSQIKYTGTVRTWQKVFIPMHSKCTALGLTEMQQNQGTAITLEMFSQN